MKRILIGTDGSPGARAAVAEGLVLARPLGAEVTFVAVRPRVAGLLGEPYYQRRLSAKLAGARTALDEALAEAERLGVEAEHQIAEGDPAEEILRVAGHLDADVIVVGSRGLGAVAGALLGSVSRFLVQHSPVPVLVVKERRPVHEQAETKRELARSA